jgi:molybdopterin-binding protein
MMKLSARNQLKGTIISVQEGAVNGIVVIDIGGGSKISSTISMNAIRELELTVGKTAYAVIKATSVMVGIDE